MRTGLLLYTAVVGALITGPLSAQPGPAPISTDSAIRIQAEYVGTMPFVEGPGLVLNGLTGPNLQSPVAVGRSLLFIDHNDGIYLEERPGDGIKKIFSLQEDAPAGLKFEIPELSDGNGGTIHYQQRQAVFNVSEGSSKDKFYVVLVAVAGSELPDVPRYTLPAPVSGPCCAFPGGGPTGFINDLYDIAPSETANFFIPFPYPGIEHQIIYEFSLKKKKLVDPRPIAIFDSQGGPLHHGSGMLTLKDGRILYITGDAVPFGLEGLSAPQDPASHLSKLVLIDPSDGSYELAASGLRNVQHIELVQSKGLSEDYLAFADIGGWTAEEVNVVKLADILDTSVVENFGWGRNPDGLAREGTFYVGPGVAFSLFSPPVSGVAPTPEVGFIQPHAQYERPDNGDPNGGVASSGPVTSKQFKDVTMLFSDLSSGILYGTTADLETVDATVYKFTIVDEAGSEYDSFLDLAGQPRVDPRFFRFPDGSAGVLLEATGDYYRLTELKD